MKVSCKCDILKRKSTFVYVRRHQSVNNSLGTRFLFVLEKDELKSILDFNFNIQRRAISILEYLRNKSWKPECVGSFNMSWRILVFYPEQSLVCLQSEKRTLC